MHLCPLVHVDCQPLPSPSVLGHYQLISIDYMYTYVISFLVHLEGSLYESYTSIIIN